MKSLVLGSLMIAATMGMANAQDLAAGEQSFRKCSPCHAVGEDAKNKVGPALNGLDGRKSGTIGDYSYSEANKKAEITWGEATFKDYIQNPMQKMPGTLVSKFSVDTGIRSRSSIWIPQSAMGPNFMVRP